MTEAGKELIQSCSRYHLGFFATLFYSFCKISTNEELNLQCNAKDYFFCNVCTLTGNKLNHYL
jgi:hypothetical protein